MEAGALYVIYRQDYLEGALANDKSHRCQLHPAIKFHVPDSRVLIGRMLRTFGGISSRWYLLFSPFAFALAWLAVLLIVL